MMRQPQEIEVWYVIPSARRELARAMMDEGMLQMDVAEVLGITSAAVSQYKHNKRAKMVDFDDNVKSYIHGVAKKVRKGEKVNIVSVINRICEMCRGPCLCKIHRKVEKVPQKCGGCFQ